MYEVQLCRLHNLFVSILFLKHRRYVPIKVYRYSWCFGWEPKQEKRWICPCVIFHNAVNGCEGMGAQFHGFLTSPLNKAKWLAPRPGRFISGENATCPTEGLEALVKTNFFVLLEIDRPGYCTDWANPKFQPGASRTPARWFEEFSTCSDRLDKLWNKRMRQGIQTVAAQNALYSCFVNIGRCSTGLCGIY